MKRILILALALVIGGGVPAFATNDSHQSVSVDMPIAAGDENIGNVDIATIAAGDTNIGNVDLASPIPEGNAVMGSVSISSFNVSLPAGNANVGDVDIATIAAGDTNIGNVDIATIAAGDTNIGNVDIASIAEGVTTIGSVTMLGNQGVAIKTDGAGQIYAIASTVAGTDIEKTYTFSAIATGDTWVEIGSHTVTTGKSCKIFEIIVTGGFDNEVKISDGTPIRDTYLQTSPASPQANVASSHPLAKATATVITIYARSYDTGNRGTAKLQMFEYTP